MGALLGREPVLFMAVVNAGIALAIGFGVKVSQEQFALIMTFVGAVLGLITRSQVTPTSKLAPNPGGQGGGVVFDVVAVIAGGLLLIMAGLIAFRF